MPLSLLCLFIVGCADQDPRKAENAKLRKQVSQEIARLCALPDPERQAQIDKVKAESGMAIVCPRP